MRKLIKNFLLWVMATDKEDVKLSRPLLVAEDHSSHPKFRLGLITALNGRILEMSTYKHNPHGPDWTSELFIIPEDQTLAQAITTVLTLKGINT